MADVPSDAELDAGEPEASKPEPGPGGPRARLLVALLLLLLFLSALMALWVFGGNDSSDGVGGVKGVTARVSPAEDQYAAEFVRPGGKLRLSLDSDRTSVSPGVALIYSAIVEKLATLRPGRVTIAVTVPRSVRVVQAFSDAGSCSLTGRPNRLTCTIPFGAKPDRARLTLRTTVLKSAEGLLEARATIKSDDLEIPSTTVIVHTALT